jgi:chromosome segregation protein
MDVISIKEGYREIAEYLLADVVLVQDLQAGLSLWNRNGYHSTMVTPDGEVIDQVGIVTGGSGAPLEGSFLAQRRRIRELNAILAGRESELVGLEQEGERLKQDLEQAETKKTVLGAEIHRLELEKVRLEHEHRAAMQTRERLAQTVQALEQEQGDLATALQSIDEEAVRCRAAAQTRAEERTACEAALAQKQAELAELSGSLQEAESAVTQSRVRNAALSEKRENTHVNLANRSSFRKRSPRKSTPAGLRSRIFATGAPRPKRLWRNAALRSTKIEPNWRRWKSACNATGSAIGKSRCALQRSGKPSKS